MINSKESPVGTVKPLRLAMLGMIEGNGHPYSWSAIVNGFDPKALAACPYPVLIRYLTAQPEGSVGFQDARVTHLWTDVPSEAAPVAAAALIPHIVKRPEDVIGQVDAVLIATDDGFDHIYRARPFIEAGLPVFIDKPLALRIEDLIAFTTWERNGARILSSSGLRYAPEIAPYINDKMQGKVGELRWASGVCCKTWERYGVHILEPLFCILGPGFTSIRMESASGLEVAHLCHRSGAQLTIPVIYDGGAAFGHLQICGTAGHSSIHFTDTYSSFRGQLRSFVDFVHSGKKPYPFEETVELMAILIAGLRSRAENSRRVDIAEILSLLSI